MFNLSNRRYTGAKTKLLPQIQGVIKSYCLPYLDRQNLSFLDCFGGTGVVSEWAAKFSFKHILVNDFLYSNYVIYEAFFNCKNIDFNKLDSIKNDFSNTKNIKQNYFSKHFGDKFFSKNDALQIGFLRDELDRLLESKFINKAEFYTLLSSLIYSTDKVANTVGHYDAYRKNIKLESKFNFELIKSLVLDSKIDIFNIDSNVLVENLVKQKAHFDIAFLDPPYNSRQYSRFYHLLETLSKNDKPKLSGIALKREPENISEYCKVNAKNALKNLCENLAKIAKFIVLTYNNTTSANIRSNVRISDSEILEILESIGKTQMLEFDFKAFNSGKSNFKEHKERIFVCQIHRK